MTRVVTTGQLVELIDTAKRKGFKLTIELPGSEFDPGALHVIIPMHNVDWVREHLLRCLVFAKCRGIAKFYLDVRREDFERLTSAETIEELTRAAARP